MLKFKSPTGKAFGDVAEVVAGVVLGAYASNVVVAAINTPTPNADDTTAKKEKTKLLITRVGIVGASAYAGAAITGNDTVSVIAKNACIGMAAMQTINGVKDYAATTSLATSTTKTGKLAKQALGLACPCDAPAYNQPLNARRRRNLGIPASPALAVSYNPLEAVYQNAAAATMQ